MQFSRRSVVFSAGIATAAFGLPGHFALHAPAQAATNSNTSEPAVRRFKVGDIECIAVNDGLWEREHAEDFIANASVADTKKALEAGGMDPARISMAMTVMIIKTGGKTYLIDSGTGGEVVKTAGSLLQSLKLAGITPEQIDGILLTHFHADHIYGMMVGKTDERVFPNAQMIMSEQEFNYWTQADIFKEQPQRRHAYIKRIHSFFPKWKNMCTMVSGEKEVIPGVRIIPAFGHSPGHSAYHIASGKDQFFYLGDTANIQALFVPNPQWHVFYDQDGPMAEASRRRLFDRLVAEKAVACCTHFAWPSMGRISKDGKGYAYHAV
jgi:glyoxylase-like metal-dependent hydrolase (beta-lactamase superfamily II)